MNDDLAEKREAELGYRETGARELGLREWMYKRENRGFDALVNRLRVKKWTREVRAEGGERLAALRAVKLAWWHRLAQVVRDKLSARKRAARRARYTKSPTIFACIQCGATWCKAPWTRGEAPRFCGNACYVRHRYATNEAWREKKKNDERARYAARRAA